MALTRTDIPGFAWKAGGRAGLHRVNPVPLRFEWYPTPIFRTRCGFDITSSWRTFHDLPPGAKICAHCERSHAAAERKELTYGQ